MLSLFRKGPRPSNVWSSFNVIQNMKMTVVFVFHLNDFKLRWSACMADTQNHRLTRIDVYETLCPQQMLVHKGGKIKNWGGECRDVTPTKSLSQNIRVDVNREVKFL